MSSPLAIALITLAATFLGGLLLIIYNNLNNKTKDNCDEIKRVEGKIDNVKDSYATKIELKQYKEEHNYEHTKQDKAYDKLDKKLDRIIQMLLEGRHES